jgi:hypothetical protein
VTPDAATETVDVDAQVPGDEATVTRYTTGCDPGGGAELWAIQGGGHIPAFTEIARTRLIDFLYDHAKP